MKRSQYQEVVYKDVPDYDRKLSEIRSRIRYLEDKRKKGTPINGAIIDGRAYAFELEKQHVLAKAQSLAKKQNKEAVVARLLKSAESANYFDQFKDPHSFLDRIGYHKLSNAKKPSIALGSVVLAAGVLASSPVAAAAGLATLCVSIAIHKNLKQRSAQYDLKKLKSYVKHGRL